MTDFGLILSTEFPGADWQMLDDEDYSTLDWRDGTVPKPSEAELIALGANLNNKKLAKRVKAEAFGRINRAFPEWRQRNFLMRGFQFLDSGQTTGAEQDAIRAIFVWIKNVRDASDLIEADALAGTPVDVKNDPRWPGAAPPTP